MILYGSSFSPFVRKVLAFAAEKELALDDVARRCKPPTTPQTLGRLETGMRTVSVGWLNRIATALGVDASDLVDHPQRDDLEVVAMVTAAGAAAPKRASRVLPPRTSAGQVAIKVSGGTGDYRTGDELWCDRLAPEEFGRALNRDILVPRPGARFLFGRLIGRDGNKLHLLPLGPGMRQTVVTDPAWAAMVVKLVRNF